MRVATLALAVVACAGQDVPAPQAPAIVHDAAVPAIVDAAPGPELGDAPGLDATLAVARPAEPEVWLRGSTHVHARPSGDSSEPIASVIAWYEARGYDFIALTDHNRVSELDTSTSTRGSPAVRTPATGLIVLAGIELTHNPSGCLPAGDTSGRCRIHVNVVGATGRVDGKLDWADRKTRLRLDKYQSALVAARSLGGVAQINHPQWFWGMSSGLLAELARRGVKLVEIANVQFARWNKGDKDHPSMEAVWDGALQQGVDIWGVASDDAHDYHNRKGDKYPAGGAWVAVKARRDPQAIADALATGRFYSSTGVVLDRVEVVNGELVVEVATAERGTFTIELIENGASIATVKGRSTLRALPRTGYLRAVVTRGDGAKAWVQPARR